MIAEHDRRHVTMYARAPGGEWSREEIVGAGDVVVPCPEANLSLDDIYEGVESMPLYVREDADDESDEWVDVTDQIGVSD